MIFDDGVVYLSHNVCPRKAEGLIEHRQGCSVSGTPVWQSYNYINSEGVAERCCNARSIGFCMVFFHPFGVFVGCGFLAGVYTPAYCVPGLRPFMSTHSLYTLPTPVYCVSGLQPSMSTHGLYTL